jgi:hypothetical protein
MAVAFSVGAESDVGRGAWVSDVACGTELPAMVAANLASCERSLCGDANPIISRVCACLKNEDTGAAEIRIDSKGQSRNLATSVMPPAFESSSFRLFKGDFVGVGGSQVLIAAMNTWGNGMGVEGWSLWVVDADSVSEPLEVEDFGVMSFLTSTAGSSRCKVFGSRWANGWEPKRGHGLYIVGQWYELLENHLFRSGSRPVLYRRYLFDLEAARGKALSAEPRRALPWYKSALTRRVVGPYPPE